MSIMYREKAQCRTTLYFLPQLSANFSNLIFCKTGLKVASKTRNIASVPTGFPAMLQNKLHVCVPRTDSFFRLVTFTIIYHHQLTVITSKAHFVQSSLTCHAKGIIFSVSSNSFRVFELHSKSAFCFCQSIHLIESEPKLAIQATKSALVVIPSSLKINWTVQSFLDHGPTSTSGFLITENIKGAWTIRVNCVNSAVSLARFVQLSTVLLNYNYNFKKLHNFYFAVKEKVTHRIRVYDCGFFASSLIY